jgi:cell division protein FtsB
MSLVTSLPPNNNPLLKKSLKELEDPKKTKDDYIEKLKKNFVKMSESLKQLKRDPRYRMEQDDETFYWVPEKTFHIEIE